MFRNPGWKWNLMVIVMILVGSFMPIESLFESKDFGTIVAMACRLGWGMLCGQLWMIKGLKY